MGENESQMSDGLSQHDIERIEHAFKKAALDDHPNLERKGCLRDKAALRGLAARRMKPSDPFVQHVAECSPCFTETMQIRRDLDRSFRRNVFIALTILAFAIVSLRRKGSVTYSARDSSVLGE